MRFCGYRAGLVYAGTVFCILTFFALAGCGGNSSKRTGIIQTDIEGLWKIVSFGHQGTIPYGSYGSLNLSSSGEVISGVMDNIGVDHQKFAGGMIAIADQGAVTGILHIFLPDSDTGEKYVIHSGQMVSEKNMIVYAGNFPMNNRGIGILMKKTGSFSASDLEGTWVFAIDGIFSVSIDINGAITGCSFLSSKGEQGTCNGRFLITPQSDISAQIEVRSNRTIQLDLNGQMSQSKDSMILAGSISSRLEGTATLAVKKSGTPSSYNMQGDWKVFRTAQNTIYGTVNVDNSGRVTRGEWTDIGAGSGAFTGGVLGITNQGVISGNITISTGNTYTILEGQMIATKDIAVISDRDSSGTAGVTVLVKTPLAE